MKFRNVNRRSLRFHAGIAGFMDVPVKRYSRGVLRLAFWVAVHLIASKMGLLQIEEHQQVDDFPPMIGFMSN